MDQQRSASLVALNSTRINNDDKWRLKTKESTDKCSHRGFRVRWMEQMIGIVRAVVRAGHPGQIPGAPDH